MLKKILVLTLTAGLITAVVGCNQNRSLRTQVTPEARLSCQGGGNSPRSSGVDCEAYVGIRITGKTGAVGANDFIALTQGRVDFSRSNVSIASTGTNILLTASTTAGPQQATFLAVADGLSARFADPIAVSNWLASVEASFGVEAIDATLAGIQYLNQEGPTALSVDVIADEGNITLSTGSFNTFVPPGTITPTADPNR
jgi:hypothetical protein